MKTALVLPGGGALGPQQAGAVEVLAENGLDPDVITTVSVGAVNGGFLAQAPPGEFLDYARKLPRVWAEVKSNDDVYRSSLFGMLCLAWRNYLYDPAPLRALLKRHIEVDRLRASGRELYMGMVEWESGKYVDVSFDQNVHMQIVASSSLPLYMPGVLYAGGHCYDGGLRNITPLKKAIEAGAEKIFVVMCNAVTENPPRVEWDDPGTIETGLRALEILIHEVLVNDLRQAEKKNSPLARDENGKPFKQIDITVISPEKTPEVGVLSFDPKKIQEMYQMGREMAAGVEV